MKKLLFLATGLITLASCSENDFIGDEAVVKSQQEEGMITFSTSSQNITRADKVGAEAAKALNNNFVVGGFKGVASVATTTVFDNYNVNYVQNTANTSESNTHNWEYVGLVPNNLTTITGAGKQTIKYWDYNQNQYDFIAYSLGTGGAIATAITPSTATNKTGGAYTLTGTTDELKTVHIADLVTVKKADYKKVVNIKFRSMTSKVRIALYETVPGYSVKDVKFYTSDAAIDGGSNDTKAALYASSSVLPTSGKYTVYFPTVNKQSTTPSETETYSTDANKAHVAFTTSTETASKQEFGTLASDKLVKRQRLEYLDAETNPDKLEFLGRSSNAATYAGLTANNYYIDVLPLEDGTSLTLKVDYTLVSIDGSKEIIKVVGAKAVVPAIYAQWKSGYAYTYIFKISDNTNGYTSGVEGSEVSGLHAITFDAVVVNAEEDAAQETVTTVATPSITTYQHVPAINASKKDEYVAGTIYAMVMEDGTPKNDLNTDPKAKFYSLSKNDATEAEVMDALLMQSKVNGTTITGRNGLVLTAGTIDNSITAIPGADGNDITVIAGTASQLNVAGGTSYAYVYTVTAPTGEAEKKYEAIPSSSITVGTTDVSNYYIYDGSKYTAATGTAASNTTYYEKYEVNNGTYAVKVIKVASGS